MDAIYKHLTIKALIGLKKFNEAPPGVGAVQTEVCLCGRWLQVRSVRHTGSTWLMEDWRMPYRLGHEGVDCSCASRYTTHTHTSAEESSQYSEYTIHCSPTAGAHSPRSCRYAILYTAACTHIAVPARPALPAANTYKPIDPALLPPPAPSPKYLSLNKQ